MKKYGTIVLAGIVCMLMVVGCPPQTSTQVRIVFESDVSLRDPRRQLSAVDLDGNDVVCLADGSDDPAEGRVTPDGQHIVYRIGSTYGLGSLVTSDIDGTNRRVLVADNVIRCSAVTGDGLRVLFMAVADGQSRIMSICLDGTGLVDLADSVPSYPSIFVPRPGTSQVLVPVYNAGNEEVYVINAAGGPAAKLAINAAMDSACVYSRDGMKLLFRSHRDGTEDLYVLNSDGTDVVRLTNTSETEYLAAFSPDGSKVLYERYDANSVPAVSSLHVVNLDGTGDVRLAEHASIVPQYAWSANGRKIVFSQWTGEQANVCVINADGTGLTQLTSSGHDYAPAWSPDGRRIIFESDRDGPQPTRRGDGWSRDVQIYCMNSNGTEQTNLTKTTFRAHFQGFGVAPQD
jgi:Tol biopolymer transport system component